MQNSYHDPSILKSKKIRKKISTSTVHYLSISNRTAILCDLQLLLLGHGLGRDNLSKTLQSWRLKPFGKMISNPTIQTSLEFTHKMVYKFPKL